MALSYQPTFRLKLIEKITTKSEQHPVKLRMTYLRKNYDRATGIHASSSEWDDSLQRITSRSRKEDNLILQAIEDRWKSVLRDYLIQEKEIHPGTLLDEILGAKEDQSSKNRVYDFFEERVRDLKQSGKIKTAEIYKYTGDSLRKFYPRADLTFNQINFTFLDKFRNFLFQSHSVNSASVLLRTLRAVYNKALLYDRFKQEKYPFHHFSIKSQPTKKRAIKREQMMRMAELDLEYGSEVWHSRNYFLFSYLTQGMNFKDLAELRWEGNISGGKISYRRSKTGDLFVIAVNEKIGNILEPYKEEFASEDGFVFPILKKDLTPTQKTDRMKKKLSLINKHLKILAKSAEIDAAETITFYVARHSFATSLKKLGYSTSLISDAMGHADEGTTQIYLDSFDNSAFDEANERLL